MNIKEAILKYALQNAVRFGGKANAGAVIGKLLSEDSKLKARIKEIAKDVQKAIKEVNALSIEAQRDKLEKIAPELLEEKKHEKEERKLPELPNAVKGKVVMRLAPYPSGPLHIGNARQCILNDEYVKMYDGKFLLVIDDTIGSEEKQILPEAYDLIPESVKWLGVDISKTYFKSDRLEIYYKYAEELIKKGEAYVCSCAQDVLKENRNKGIECECRSRSADENLKLWKEMPKAKEGSCVLRIKTDMNHPNPAFRDRVLFRISNREHPKTGKKYRVWPLLEFSWAIDDHLLGMTHVIRGKDLMIESDMEKFIWDIFGWKHAVLMHTGLLQLAEVKISKSKSSKEVKEGVYFGWDDPRTWSLQSLKRRGIKPEAIRAFCLGFGMTQTEITVPIETLYSENRKLLDAACDRYFFVENPRKITIKDAPELKVNVPLHPDSRERGSRIFRTKQEFYIQDELKKNVPYRLMHLFNFKNNSYISTEKDDALGAKLIHWLPVSKEIADAEILMPDASVVKGVAEEGVKKLKEGDVIQFERVGFCRFDRKEGNKFIFWFAHR